MHGYALDRPSLVRAISGFRRGKILLLGDVMLDEYLEGDAERISPEAPIPVVRVSQTRTLLGGAGNVARNIASLGGHTHLISICGSDEKSERLKNILQETNIAASLVSLPHRPTTLKTRVIARNQQMLRIDHEECSPLTSLEIAQILDRVRAEIEGYPVVVVSDYGKGIVSEEFFTGLMELCRKARSTPKVLVDPKTPNYPLYTNVHLLTPNTKETGEAANLPVSSKEEVLAAGRKILQILTTENLLTTLGSRGMALFRGANEVWHIPTAARKVFDVTGAGDTVMGTLALGLATGCGLLESCILANFAAGLVVGDVGASTVLPETLSTVVTKADAPEIVRWV